MSNDLEVVIPQQNTLVIRRTPDFETDEIISETVIVRHLRMADLPAVFKSIGPLQEIIMGGARAGFDPRMEFLKHSGEVSQLIASAMRKPVEWVGSLEIDSAVQLFARLLEVNLDFFTKNVLPSVLQAMAGAKRNSKKVASPPDGPNSSDT